MGCVIISWGIEFIVWIPDFVLMHSACGYRSNIRYALSELT